MSKESDKIKQSELIDIFGSTMPIEAYDILFNSPDTDTISEVRQKLKELGTMGGYVNCSARRSPTICGAQFATPDMVSLGVLVQRFDKTFVVYLAFVPDVSLTDPTYSTFVHAVMRNGRKASFDEARLYFPTLDVNDYGY